MNPEREREIAARIFGQVLEAHRGDAASKAEPVASAGSASAEIEETDFNAAIRDAARRPSEWQVNWEQEGDNK